MINHKVLEVKKAVLYLQATKIKDKYLPIEMDPNLSIEEKIPHMIEWFVLL
jgi:hypothetical protein